MAVGEDVADPEARAIIELAQTLVPAALRAVEQWEQLVDWSAGDLAIEVRSWTPRVNVVSRALTAVDEHWRLATAILDAEIPADSTGLGCATTSTGRVASRLSTPSTVPFWLDSATSTANIR
jgi:hypothetical protein